MTRFMLSLALAAMLVVAGAQSRTYDIQVRPPGADLNSLLPTPAPKGPVFTPAPVPDVDATGPQGPRATLDPSLSPGLFHRSEQYRGEGYSSGSSAQAEQERRVRPGAGFKLRLPIAPQ